MAGRAEERFIGMKDAARILDVVPTTIQRWIDSGVITSYRTVGGHRRILRDDFVRFLKEQHYPFQPDQPPRVLIVDDSAYALKMLREKIIAEYPDALVDTAEDGVAFDKVGGLGSGKGFKAMMAGEVQIAGLSRVLNAAEKKLKPYYQIIAYDAVAVYVNDKNPVKAVTKEQLKGIFTGKIKNWKEVGGGDAQITVITEIKTGGRATIKEFREMAMDNAEFGVVQEVDKPHDCVKAVAEDENAITFASLAFKEPGAESRRAQQDRAVEQERQERHVYSVPPAGAGDQDAAQGRRQEVFRFHSRQGWPGHRRQRVRAGEVKSLKYSPQMAQGFVG